MPDVHDMKLQSIHTDAHVANASASMGAARRNCEQLGKRSCPSPGPCGLFAPQRPGKNPMEGTLELDGTAGA